ncbi:MAG: four helix bundle protein [bacterium]|nr:four helix bundle protein [bacterium]
MGNRAVQSYQDLAAWQEARVLVRMVYEMSKTFPADERFGLVSQIRRCAVSVPSNIAEGYGRGSRNDYSRFLRIARGSLFEIETQLILASDLGFIEGDAKTDIQEQIDRVARPLWGLIRSVENTQPSRVP